MRVLQYGSMAKIVYSDLNVVSIPLVLFMVLSLRLSADICIYVRYVCALSEYVVFSHPSSCAAVCSAHVQIVNEYEPQ